MRRVRRRIAHHREVPSSYITTRAHVRPAAWTLALNLDAPAAVSYQGWLSMPLEGGAARAPCGIRIEARDAGAFSIGCVQEDLADIVLPGGQTPRAISVKADGVVEHDGRVARPGDRFEPVLGDVIRIRGIEAQIGVSGETCDRWYRSVNGYERTTIGNIIQHCTLCRSDAAARTLLIVSDGTHSMRKHQIRTQCVRIGRSPDNDVTLCGDGSSRFHCRIERRGCDDWVVDEGSANGTHVNGVRIDAPHRLMHGDCIRLSKSEEIRYAGPSGFRR